MDLTRAEHLTVNVTGGATDAVVSASELLPEDFDLVGIAAWRVYLADNSAPVPVGSLDRSVDGNGVVSVSATFAPPAGGSVGNGTFAVLIAPRT